MSEIVEQPAQADSAGLTQQAAPELNPEGIQTEDGLTTELEIQPPEDETEEVDYEGEKFKVPSKLKAAFFRHQDYTQKTQELAEERRAVHAEREQHQQQQRLSQELKQDEFRLFQVDSRLQQLSQINLHAVRQQNPELAEQLRDEFIKLQGIRPAMMNAITQKTQATQLAEREKFANLTSKAEAYIKREVKDWSPAKDAEFEAYARGKGVDTKRLGELMLHSPAIAVVIDNAMKWEQSLKKLSVKPSAPPAQPITRVPAKASPAIVDEDKMSVQEWKAHREKQLAQRRQKR